MSTAFGVISVLLVLRGRAAWVYTVVPSVVFLFVALVLSKALSPVEKYWMRLASVIGFIMTDVLLVLVYICNCTHRAASSRIREELCAQGISAGSEFLLD